MAEQEENINVVTVENQNGKGNPNHVPAGDPSGKGGQFTSKEGSGVGQAEKDEDSLGTISFEEAKPEKPVETVFSTQVRAFIAKKKAQWDKEAKDFQTSVIGEFSEDKKAFYEGLAREEKLELLYNSPIGYDKKKLAISTDEQLTALLYSEAVKNKRVQLEQELKIWQQNKDNEANAEAEYLVQMNMDGFSGIWFGKTVHPADWKNLKESGSIDKKREYYNAVLANPSAVLVEKAKAKQYLAKLEEFEKLGAEYENAKEKYKLEHLDLNEEIETKIGEISKQINNYSEDSPIIQLCKDYQNRFIDPNAVYSEQRKNNATWITEKWIKEHPEYSGLNVYQASIKHFGDRFEKMWKSMTSEERNQLKDYTGGGYSKYNKPLRGLSHSGWSGWGFADGVTKLTSAIDKCIWDEDIWVQRGISDSGMFKLPGSNQLRTLGSLSEKERQSLIGTSFKDNGFYSAGAGKGTGFSGDIIFNTYCPKGTKMAYMNTKGHYAGGSENEMILQRGYSYRITKIEKNQYGNFYVDCEVILDSDNDKITDIEQLKNIGSKHLY